MREPPKRKADIAEKGGCMKTSRVNLQKGKEVDEKVLQSPTVGL